MEPFFKKYLPKTSAEVIGQDKAVEELSHFIKNFKKQKRKAVLLYGPPGTGKSSAVHALGKDLNLEVLEINASDVRNAEQINSLLGSASKQLSLFAKGKLILVDEIDGLSGTKDRGGLQALVGVIPNSSFPIVCVCQNPYDQKLSTLRQKTEMIQFHTLNYLSIAKILKLIVKSEHIEMDDDLVNSIARRAGGDARSAANDLQMLALAGEITKEDIDLLGEREKTESMMQSLFKVFKNSDPVLALTAFDHVDEDIEKQMLWIDENLPKEYTDPVDLAKAYDHLSKASVFYGRIRRWQYWRYLVYANVHLTAGIATAKKEKSPAFVKYAPTGRILKLWQAKMKYMKRKAIAEKIAEKTHVSTRVALQSTVPYVKLMYKRNIALANSLTDFFDFNNDEVAWLKA